MQRIIRQTQINASALFIGKNKKKERLVDNYDEIYNERKGFKDNDGEGNGCN